MNTKLILKITRTIKVYVKNALYQATVKNILINLLLKIKRAIKMIQGILLITIFKSDKHNYNYIK